MTSEVRGVPASADSPQLSVAEIREQLRRGILDGHLRPGEPLSQVQLAAVWGISRGKLREALRMLQEEGLVEGREFQRLRVASFNVDELDSMYALRIVTETLGATRKVPRLTAVEKMRLTSMAKLLRTSSRGANVAQWNAVHDEFHDVLAGRTEGLLAEQMRSFSERSDRYRRMYFHVVEQGLASRPSEHEHKHLADSAIAGNTERTTLLLATHYARTAYAILEVMAPGDELQAVPAALRLLRGDASQNSGPARVARSRKSASK